MSEEHKKPENSGGVGGECLSVARENKIIAKALCERWPIPKTKRRKLIKRMIDIVETGKDRTAVGAMRAIIAAEAQNMEQERRDLKIPDYHDHNVKVEFLDRARKYADARRLLSGGPGSEMDGAPGTDAEANGVSPE